MFLPVVGDTQPDHIEWLAVVRVVGLDSFGGATLSAWLGDKTVGCDCTLDYLMRTLVLGVELTLALG